MVTELLLRGAVKLDAFLAFLDTFIKDRGADKTLVGAAGPVIPFELRIIVLNTVFIAMIIVWLVLRPTQIVIPCTAVRPDPGVILLVSKASNPSFLSLFVLHVLVN